MYESNAYAAGLFDGEGSIIISARGSRIKSNSQRSIYYHLSISIANTHHGIMEYLRLYYDGLINNGRVTNGKPIWFWTLHSRNAASFLDNILPYLIIKKEEAKIAIEFQDHMDEPIKYPLSLDVIAYRETFRTRIKEARSLYSKQSHEPES